MGTSSNIGVLQALENNENTAIVLHHEQKRAVHWEPWQSPVQVVLLSLKPAKPINQGAMWALQALKERAAKSNETSEAPSPA